MSVILDFASVIGQRMLLGTASCSQSQLMTLAGAITRKLCANVLIGHIMVSFARCQRPEFEGVPSAVSASRPTMTTPLGA